jgi:hypothetical protein
MILIFSIVIPGIIEVLLSMSWTELNLKQLNQFFENCYAVG